MGTGGPGLWGTRPRLTATTLIGPPHLYQAAPAGSSCVQVQGGPDLQEGPRREVPGFPLRESQWKGSQAGGVGLQICNSWTSQK